MTLLRSIQAWPGSPAPGIKATPIPCDTLRAMRQALRAVDLDIEQHGSVSAETVDMVRAARLKLEACA